MVNGLLLDIGACIYCGDKAPPLSREHVLPRGLGGNMAPDGYSDALVLQNASCERCRRVTQKIEEQCLLSMMGPGRAKLGLKRKDRVSGTTKALIDRSDGTSEERELDWSYVPGPVIIPAFYEAAELSKKPTPAVAPCDFKMIVVAPPTKAMHGGVNGVGVSLTADSQVFAQMLAKIALGVAVARLGIEGFEPSVRDLILTNPSEYGRWVGGFGGSKRVEPRTSDLHSVALKVRGAYVIVEICLFAAFGGPTNYVVVGRPR
ncbi:MAG: hypothetical protein HKUEN01_02920 [Candidatus Kuenenia stuttgartiensis]|nr:MAG: hypothetical protein HKUEN01_02920 [Candidatus Kuenenia stuttgartiensis]